VFTNPPDDVVRALLARRLNVAVVGCSPNPARDSHRIARLLLERGHRVFPVNPAAGPEILGQRVYGDLLAVPERVDMVDIFRRSDQVGPIVAAAIEKGVEAVWTQLGVIDEAAAELARQAGLTVIMDRCPAIEYPRLFGR